MSWVRRTFLPTAIITAGTCLGFVVQEKLMDHYVGKEVRAINAQLDREEMEERMEKMKQYQPQGMPEEVLQEQRAKRQLAEQQKKNQAQG